jgi:hypothetical protein
MPGSWALEGGFHVHGYLTEELTPLPKPYLFFQPTGLQEVVDIGTWGTPEQSPVVQGEET